MEVVSPAENFEKILINLNYGSCSMAYKEGLIEFCAKYRLATGVMHLCMQAYGSEGPVRVLRYLRDFYHQACKEDTKQVFGPTSLQTLAKMPASSLERLPLERSAKYLGLKLLWAI